MEPSLWSVVLAAGRGRRLATLTRGIPKQFWRPAGDSSLLDDTLRRLAPLCAPERTVIVVDSGHQEYVNREQYRELGHVAFQPADRGTAAGVLFGLTPVLAADPGALVVLTPSDHGIRNSTTFRRGIADAVGSVRSSGGVVLLGVEPSTASDDLGWISLDPGSRADGLRSVNGFVEKPHATLAQRLLASGAVWNTMVLVARAKDLLDLHEVSLPDPTAVFLRALAIPERARDSFFGSVYPLLPTSDFSRDVLARARGLLAYTWPASMGWSDLGTPERLREWVRPTPPKAGAAARLEKSPVAGGMPMGR